MISSGSPNEKGKFKTRRETFHKKFEIISSLQDFLGEEALKSDTRIKGAIYQKNIRSEPYIRCLIVLCTALPQTIIEKDFDKGIIIYSKSESKESLLKKYYMKTPNYEKAMSYGDMEEYIVFNGIGKKIK